MSLIDLKSQIAWPTSWIGVPPGGVTLDSSDPEEHVAFVIQVPKTGTLKKIGWKIYSVSSPVLTVKVCLETVGNTVGVPISATYATKVLYAPSAESADITSFSAGTRFDEINGSTGISVTGGDFMAVTIRCTARTSGNIIVGASQYGGSSYACPWDVGYVVQTPVYTYLSVGGTGTQWYWPFLTLEYDGEFVPVHGVIPCATGSSLGWNSGSTTAVYGMKFKTPFGCRLCGCWINADFDQDVNLYLYDSDEYTVFSGFPLTLSSTKRKFTSGELRYILFTTQPTLSANTWYRLAIVPTTTTPNVTTYYCTPSDDGTITGMSGLLSGTDVIATKINSLPSSGSHSWTDTDTVIMMWWLAIDQIDIGSGPLIDGRLVR